MVFVAGSGTYFLPFKDFGFADIFRIFILEGILTCVVAIGAWFIILDFLDKAAKQGFLSEREANYVLRRIEEDRGDSEVDPLTWAKFFKHLSDLKLWAFCTLFMSTTVPVYAFSYFTPVILVGMGKSSPLAFKLLVSNSRC